jgi:DUF1009 family protein
MTAHADTSGNVGIVAGGGALPLAVARSLEARKCRPVVFAIKGYCAPEMIKGRAHHWIALGQIGRVMRLLREEDCQTVVWVGSLTRPALKELRLDWQTILLMPSLVRSFRGGDDHLLTGVARIFEDNGIKLVGVNEIAPDLTMPEGALTRLKPDASAQRDIAKGRAALAAMSAFDVGQAAVVIDQHVIALEDIGGTDALLARVADLRKAGRLRSSAGRGVLVKAPKTGQDLRFDMPALGPQTIAGAEHAQLAGIAVVAHQTLLAEPEAVVASADRAGLFVVGDPA